MFTKIKLGQLRRFMGRLSLIFLWVMITSVVIDAQRFNPADGVVFDDDVLPRVDILMPEDSLMLMLHPDSIQSFYHWHADFIFDNGSVKDTIKNIGFRLRGNTSRFSAKKSFKVSFNTYDKGRKWHGLEKLNLNGEHNDPSLCRARLNWSLHTAVDAPASRVNHVRLFINGDFFGLYANVEHIDEQFLQSRFGNKNGNLFKCFWPADLKYKGENPLFYQGGTFGNRTYDLKNNQEADDYTDLIQFLKVLNDAPLEELECALEEHFNVDSYLKILALEILTGHWDGPVFNTNNFYLYHNTSTDRFEFIPYDLDNTFGITWSPIDWAKRDIFDWISPNNDHPIYRRVLEVPIYRARFSFIVDDILEKHFNAQKLYPKLDKWRAQLLPFIADDPFYPLDYGFSAPDFGAAFDGEPTWFHVPYNIKTYIVQRALSTSSQTEFYSFDPFISDVIYNLSGDQKTLSVGASVVDEDGVTSAEVCYSFGAFGTEVCIDLADDGMHDDGVAGDQFFKQEISIPTDAEEIFFRIKGTYNGSQISFDPECRSYRMSINRSNISLAVNELLASNDNIIADEFGEYDDWIELYNYGTDPISTQDLFISDNENNPDKWAMADTTINAGEFILIWADDDEEQGRLHTNFKLSAGGEFVGVYQQMADTFLLVDGISFGTQSVDTSYGRIPDGLGPWEAMLPTPGLTNATLTHTLPKISKALERIRVFPNPFEDKVNLDNLPEGETEIVVLDMLGKIVIHRYINQSKIQLSLPNTGPFFLVKIRDDRGSQKVIKLVRI